MIGILAVMGTGCAPDPPPGVSPSNRGDDENVTATAELTVFVAMSMVEVLNEVAAAYEAETGGTVHVSGAATGVLRRQIEAGAACDVFIAADAEEMARLESKGGIIPETRRVVARNRLVVITCGSQLAEWETLEQVRNPESGRIALGDPAYVPAGRYAKHALIRAGVWEAVQDRLVPADNVRVVCQYVRLGQARVGMVYATDAALMPECRVLLEIDGKLTGPVTCPGAVCKSSRNVAAARALLDRTAASAESWEKRGFLKGD